MTLAERIARNLDLALRLPPGPTPRIVGAPPARPVDPALVAEFQRAVRERTSAKPR